MNGVRVTSGHLFFFAAYDAGFEIALGKARTLCEAFDAAGIAGLRPMLADLVEEYCLWHAGELSPEMTGTEALERFPQDIARLLADWNAAFVYDPKFQDTVEVLEFLNVQCLELRFFDRVLHEAIDGMAEELRPRRRLFRILRDPYETPMRKLSRIRTDVSLVRERIYNTLKLVGDAYLARVYEEARRKVGAEKHETTVRDQLGTLTDIYTVLNYRAQAARSETLELIIILLIAFEIVMGLLRW